VVSIDKRGGSLMSRQNTGNPTPETFISVNVGSYACVMIRNNERAWKAAGVDVPSSGSFLVEKRYLDPLLATFNGWIKWKDPKDWDMTSFTRYIVRSEVD